MSGLTSVPGSRGSRSRLNVNDIYGKYSRQQIFFEYQDFERLVSIIY
ncbi:hypothetical protein [Iningainema tapete]|uniref:Uncharacterized protein n=1 Tax=Iningainema tapete BLCC-T55 TaxID=2748662 RepID=A0A8J6XIN3_9CYAN|nr:hypothetical protein [Iningainema tapete]MBD2773472.1 hypothetical protein [Iningainema tapete BLCC-T55]